MPDLFHLGISEKDRMGIEVYIAFKNTQSILLTDSADPNQAV